MRMLCIAAQHDPIGFVSVNSVPLDSQGIARLCAPAIGMNEVEALLGELARNGVYTRDKRGAIYNRRMVRDAKKAAIARENGKLGGNPILKNLARKKPLSGRELPKSPPTVTISKIKQKPILVKGQDKGGLNGRHKLKLLPIPKDKILSCGSGKKRENRHFNEMETEQWKAWEKHYLDSGGDMPEPIPHWETKKLGWYFPTEWPPSQTREARQEP